MSHMMQIMEKRESTEDSLFYFNKITLFTLFMF